MSKELPLTFFANVPWDHRTPWGEPIQAIAAPPRLNLGPLTGLVLLLNGIWRGLRLWWKSRDPRSVVLLNLGDRAAFWFGLFRSLWRTPGKAVASHIYLHRWPCWKRVLIRRALGTVSAVAVWSDYQARHAELLLGTSGPVFVKVPYKANHSQQPREPELPIGDYVFSGGNTERDYRTLFAAVEGLPLRVIVSCTDATVLQGLRVPANVIVVAAREPHFRRLMAGARMVVLCIKPGLLRGAGEATFLNAMWHGRPVLVADDGSAREYLEDGVTGCVVPAEDVKGLRQRIVELWQDDERCEEIGAAGRRLVEEKYTGRHWRERMMRLALDLQNEIQSEEEEHQHEKSRLDHEPRQFEHCLGNSSSGHSVLRAERHGV